MLIGGWWRKENRPPPQHLFCEYEEIPLEARVFLEKCARPLALHIAAVAILTFLYSQVVDNWVWRTSCYAHFSVPRLISHMRSLTQVLQEHGAARQGDRHMFPLYVYFRRGLPRGLGVVIDSK